MSQLLHLRVGRFFEASSLSRAQGLVATLELTARLDELVHRRCRAIEWFSATQAWCDLGSGRDGLSPWVIADRLHHEIKSTLAIEVACGVASTRSASHAASALARPSGLVVVLPGYEHALLDIARKDGVIINSDLDNTPLKPSFVPRAIVRSTFINLNTPGPTDPTDVTERIDACVATLVDDARRGMTELGVLAATVRVQFTSAAGTREHFVTLPDATSIEEILAGSAHRLGRRIVAGLSAEARSGKADAAPAANAGRLAVSLSNLISGPAQGTLFGWRYDRHGHAAQRLA
jgi:hypothetical protein